MQTRVRSMSADDIPTLADWVAQVPLWRRYQLNAEKARHQFEAALQQGDILLVADCAEGARACGFVWVMPQGGFGHAYLRLIGVQPAYAGQGLGAALLAAAETRAAERSPSMFLLVSDFNTEAQRFYQKHGYRPVGAIPAFVLPDVAERIFYKPLQRA